MADPITIGQAIRGGAQLFRLGKSLFGGSRRDDRADIEAAAARSKLLGQQFEDFGGVGAAKEELGKLGGMLGKQAVSRAALEVLKKAGEALKKAGPAAAGRGRGQPTKQAPRRGRDDLPDPGKGIIKREQAPIARQTTRRQEEPPKIGREPPRTGRDVQISEQPPRTQTRTTRNIPAPSEVGPFPEPAVSVPPAATKSLFPALPIALGTAGFVGFLATRDLTKSDRKTAATGTRMQPDVPLPGGETPIDFPGDQPEPPPSFPPDPLTISAAASSFGLGSFASVNDPILRNILAQLAAGGTLAQLQTQTETRRETTTRTKVKECQEVLRRRRRRGKCREGFFEEMPGRTRYTTWRVRDCATQKVLSENT